MVQFTFLSLFIIYINTHARGDKSINYTDLMINNVTLLSNILLNRYFLNLTIRFKTYTIYIIYLNFCINLNHLIHY